MSENEIYLYKCKQFKQSSVLILGGSRGLGRAISEFFYEPSVLSRTSEIQADLSRSESLAVIKDCLKKNSFEYIFYVAGGGVHGEYFSKPPHSHRWTYEVNFLRPVEIAHCLKEMGHKGKFVYIGSAIAERSQSPLSLSYSQAKKNCVQCLLNLREEELKVRVFSPPYIDTGLLPKNSWPRLKRPDLVISPQKVTEVLTNWLILEKENPSGGFDSRHFDWIDRFTYTLSSDELDKI